MARIGHTGSRVGVAVVVMVEVVKVGERRVGDRMRSRRLFSMGSWSGTTPSVRLVRTHDRSRPD
jgi:hypothetical protein